MDTPRNTPPDATPEPDQNEGLNIAAAAREKDEPKAGREPVSLWTFLLAAVVLLFAGAYLGNLSGGFDNEQFTAIGYTPQLPPGVEADEITRAWIDEYMTLGRRRFGVCAGCHGTDGSGNSAQGFPSLHDNEWTTGYSEKLAMIILAGMEGPVEVHGTIYNNIMPSQAAGLTARDLGAVMTYVRRSWGNDASIVTPEMAQVALDLYQERIDAGLGAVTASELRANHANMLPGAEVDPETGEPLSEGSGGGDPTGDEEVAALSR